MAIRTRTETITQDKAPRRNIPMAEYQWVMEKDAGAEFYRHDAKSGMVALKVKTTQRIRSQLSAGEFDFSRHAFQAAGGAEHQWSGDSTGWKSS